MIERLYLNRFQGFAISQSIRLAPITLIFGPNAAGKSSILRALRLLDQSFEGDGRLKFNGPKASLGGFPSLVHRGGSESDFEVGFVSDLSNTARRLQAEALTRMNSVNYVGRQRTKIQPESMSNTLAEISLTVDDVAGGFPKLALFKHQFKFQDETPTQEFRDARIEGVFARHEVGGGYVYRLESIVFDEGADFWIKNILLPIAERNDPDGPNRSAVPDTSSPEMGNWEIFLKEFDYSHERYGLLPSSTDMGAFRKSLQAETLEAGYARDFASAYFPYVNRLLSPPRTSNVGPLREISQAFSSGEVAHELEADGSNILDYLMGLSERDLSAISLRLEMLTDGRFGVKLLSTRDDESNIGMEGYEVAGGEFTRLFLVDHHNKTLVSPINAGAGLSQVLPVVVGLTEPEGDRNKRRVVATFKDNRRARIALIEQPELHLHPAMQAELASLFLSTLETPAAQSHNLERVGQIVVETHSESLLL
jgi:energy-coupling factor transporter ATP-binding protein EcfA2